MGILCSCIPQPEESEEMVSQTRNSSCYHCSMRWCMRLVYSCIARVIVSHVNTLFFSSQNSVQFTYVFSPTDIRESNISVDNQAMLSSVSPPGNQRMALLSPAVQPSDNFRNIPRPLPFETDVSYLRREGLSRRDKSNSGTISQEQEPLRRNRSLSFKKISKGMRLHLTFFFFTVIYLRLPFQRYILRKRI